ncbi:MAG: ABC transporter ATP-binding protein [Patescibacteria group bacterium]
MARAIEVSNLAKHFRAYKKEGGFFGSFKSFFHRKYETVKAVENVSFAIEEGELIGFIGPNGAGKTTTLKMLSGLIHPTSGDISVLGFYPFSRKPAFLKEIALVMGQKAQLWWDLPPIDTFLLNKEIYGISDRQYKETLDELVELMQIQDVLHIQVRNLSLGQRMKCELIAALIHQPKILFLDEPTIGLDVVMQQNLREFIRSYNTKHNSTILLTSHYMEDVKELCKRIIVIDHGRVLYDGKLENVIKKYTTHKLLSIKLHKPIEQKDVSDYGVIKHFDPQQIKLSVKQEKVTEIAATLLKKFPVEDLTIEETDIEDIVRSLFTKKDV